MNKKIKGYYFITDESLSRAGNIKDAENAVRSGVEILQYRNKNGTTRQMYEEATSIKKLCGKALFLINDRIDIALACDADGVHVGQDDLSCAIARRILGKSKIVGVTVHNIEEAKKAEKDGADYLGISPIFSTSTKADAGQPAGIELIRKIKKIISLPLVAIGGINLENAKSVVDAGADAICCISAVITKDDVVSEIKKFQELFK
jgi:thiamine-phosphate pyrophosphorylase